MPFIQNRRHFLTGLSMAGAACLAGAAVLLGARRAADYDPEDTIRFYARRLHELGMIKSTPDKIIAKVPIGGF